MVVPSGENEGRQNRPHYSVGYDEDHVVTAMTRVLLETELQILADGQAEVVRQIAAEYSTIQFEALLEDMNLALGNILRLPGLDLEDYKRGWTESVQILTQLLTIRKSTSNLTIRTIPAMVGRKVVTGVVFEQGPLQYLVRTLSQAHPRVRQTVRIRRRL